MNPSSAVELSYSHRPTNVFPHWFSWQYAGHGAVGWKQTKDGRWVQSNSSFIDCRIAEWLLENIGPGGVHSGQYKNQKWWANIGCKEVGFRIKEDAMFFKLTWAGYDRK